MLAMAWAWLSWIGCAEEPAPPAAPASHTWADEAELVVKGLDEVEALHAQGQKSAARTMSARVYTDRYEPRLEPALRKAEGEGAVLELEYEFGQLTLALDSNDPKVVEARVAALQRRVRAVADAAKAAVPPPGSTPAAEAAPRREARPEVPDVPPNWEAGEAPAAGAEAAPTDNH
ncbi:MAG: hypothetical protein FJ090_16735 [Deltaproteobacteria bacterium]|nr:hypothetical protein [Deltaproteobacteria bacterium]